MKKLLIVAMISLSVTGLIQAESKADRENLASAIRNLRSDIDGMAHNLQSLDNAHTLRQLEYFYNALLVRYENIDKDLTSLGKAIKVLQPLFTIYGVK